MALTVAGGPSGRSGPAGPSVTGDPDVDRRARWAAVWTDPANLDQWKRRKIALADGSGKFKGYRRASSCGSPNEYDGNLINWYIRQAIRGVALDPVMQMEIARHHLHADGEGPAAQAAKKELDRIGQEAMAAVGSSDKAKIGTNLHAILEAIDLGRDPGYIAPEWEPDVDAYIRLMSSLGLRHVSVEEFVVEDEFQVCGTYDRCTQSERDDVTPEFKLADGTIIPPTVIPAGSVSIGDVKTAQNMNYAGAKFGCQVREYANGTPYDPERHTRMAWDDDAARFGWGHPAPRTDYAMIFSVPSGSGRAERYWVYLPEYDVAIADAMTTYGWRSTRGKRPIVADDPAVRIPTLVAHYRARIEHAATRAVLHDLHERARLAGCVTGELRVALNERWHDLTGVSA